MHPALLINTADEIIVAHTHNRVERFSEES
jgi:hypothetical protein